MPLLAWFTVSGGVLTNPFTQQATAVDMLELFIGIPHTVPEDASAEYREQFSSLKHKMTPMLACVQWIGQPGEEGEAFETQIVILAPDDKQTEVPETLTEFKMPTPLYKTFMQTPLIGLRIPGVYRFRVQLRKKDGEWSDAAEHRFLVLFPEHLQSPETQATEQPDDNKPDG